MASIPLFRTDDLRHIEAKATHLPLMQRAGNEAAELAMTLAVERNAPVLILAGPGNNGGDAFVTAQYLREQFFDTRVVFAGKAEQLPPDAADAYRRFNDAGGTTLPSIPENSAVSRWSLIIDGLFGIGLKRGIAEPYASLIKRANMLATAHRCPLLAIDCPSGLNSDTGTTHGESIHASHTITFIGAKPGLFTADGPDHCGKISIADIGLAPEQITPAKGRTIGLELFKTHLIPRLRNSHKGSYGSLGIIGGAPGMVGAAFLAGRAALRLGSGRVYLGFLDEEAPTVDIAQPELMIRRPEHLLAADLTALACGPGMGTSHQAHDLLETACKRDLPLVIDADALNLLATDSSLQTAVSTRTAPTLLTPHPAEAARLLNCSTANIQADRLSHTSELATRFKAFVALKGCGTVIASPDKKWFINASGNPGLATAGSGDVLTGLIGSILSQNWPPLDTLLASVYLHGNAADKLVAQGQGPIGLTASEVIDSSRHEFNQWIYSNVSS